jgi:hypothetical protein
MATRPVDVRDDLRRLHQAARISHGTAWEPVSPLAHFRALPVGQRLLVVLGGVVFALLFFFGLPWLIALLYVAVTGQVPS